MALSYFLILSRPRSGRVEGRRALIQPRCDLMTASLAGVTSDLGAMFPATAPRAVRRVRYRASAGSGRDAKCQAAIAAAAGLRACVSPASVR